MTCTAHSISCETWRRAVHPRRKQICRHMYAICSCLPCGMQPPFPTSSAVATPAPTRLPTQRMKMSISAQLLTASIPIHRSIVQVLMRHWDAATPFVDVTAVGMRSRGVSFQSRWERSSGQETFWFRERVYLYSEDCEKSDMVFELR